MANAREGGYLLFSFWYFSVWSKCACPKNLLPRSISRQHCSSCFPHWQFIPTRTHQLVPTMREALCHYSRAEYGQCLSLLQHSSIRRDLLLDIHLHAHVPALLDMIRDRCIVQYFRPYSSVSLEKMGRVFGCNAREMEEVVAKLISGTGNDGAEEDEGMSLGDGARINALEKTLSVEGPRSVERRARRRARVRAAKMGVVFARNAEGMIMREYCQKGNNTFLFALFCFLLIYYDDTMQAWHAWKMASRSRETNAPPDGGPGRLAAVEGAGMAAADTPDLATARAVRWINCCSIRTTASAATMRWISTIIL